MPEPFVIKRNDLGRGVDVWVVPNTDITGATGVVFNLRRADTLAMVITRGVAEIVQFNPARLRYPWATGQTVTAGIYEFEFEMMLAGGKPVTVPSFGYYPLIIDADLG